MSDAAVTIFQVKQPLTALISAAIMFPLKVKSTRHENASHKAYETMKAAVNRR